MATSATETGAGGLIAARSGDAPAMTDRNRKSVRSARRTALILALIALAVYAGFILSGVIGR